MHRVQEERMTVFETDFEDLTLVHRGKVRDVYEVDGHFLIVATDRLSAFDVVLPDPIPGKGSVLTSMSLFWFDMLGHIVPNHLVSAEVDDYPAKAKRYADLLQGRSMLVKKAEPLPIECIVRGYITGSGWKEYQKKGSVCGISLPHGLQESQRLPDPIFTPSTKAEAGEHDENISFEVAVSKVGLDLAERVKEISLALYDTAASYAMEKGVIIADTKFEFGMCDGVLTLIDEVLTPDSSRFWPADKYQVGKGQPSFDKQFVRDYLESVGWDKSPPAPRLPADIIEKTAARYQDALERLTGAS